jgi:hypothetical protein
MRVEIEGACRQTKRERWSMDKNQGSECGMVGDEEQTRKWKLDERVW